MIRTLITETYGGKIDNESDFNLLRQLVTNFLTPSAYEIGHKLVEGTNTGAAEGDDGSLTVPSGTGFNEFKEWVKKLPEREPPTYLGLPANAEKLLLVGQGRNVIGDLGRITEMLDEGEQIMAEAAEAA